MVVEKRRDTKETQIELKLNIYGSGKSKIDTGVGFFNHMLESFAKHAHIDLEVKCKGDTHIDDHHSVEDVGIVLGSALYEAIYPVSNVERFGNGTVVMDEASVSCDIDLSNRPFLVYEVPLDGVVGKFDTELVEEFFRAVAFNAHITIHLIYNRGKNRHHIIEASFKAFALSLRRALAHNENAGIPSTKGVL
jgi:imidazoleglycerol-phosphate dehydratase